MRLSPGWEVRLGAPRTRKVVLCSIAWGSSLSRLRSEAGEHIAREPGTLRAATEPAHVPDQGDLLPFWPTLQSWPEIRLRWSPVDHRAETSETTFDLLGADDVIERIRESGDQPIGWGRLDLWSDGIELADVIPLLEGPVSVVHKDRYAAGAVRLRLTDADIDRQVLFPPGPITRDEFPDAPDTVAGTANRQIILGPFPRRVKAHQIDREARRFYLCEPPVRSAPVEFFIGSDAVSPSVAPRVTVGLGAASGFTYTELEFAEPVYQGAQTGRVSCSGGVGFSPASPVVDLLTTYGGYRLTPGARSILDTLTLRTFPSLAVFANASANILDLARDRLLPQTDLVMAWRRGAIEVLRLNGQGAEVRMGIGTGLLFRAEEQTPETSVDQVRNAFEVRYSRNASGRSTSTQTGSEVVTIDSDFGGSIGALLAASQVKYGRRFQVTQANDLDSRADAVDLGIAWARTGAFAHRRRRYLCDWLLGMALDWNTRVIATDEDWEDVPTRVVEWLLTASGPVAVLETEDVEAA